jgi:hypothetical protein
VSAFQRSRRHRGFCILKDPGDWKTYSLDEAFRNCVARHGERPVHLGAIGSRLRTLSRKPGLMLGCSRDNRHIQAGMQTAAAAEHVGDLRMPFSCQSTIHHGFGGRGHGRSDYVRGRRLSRTMISAGAPATGLAIVCSEKFVS